MEYWSVGVIGNSKRTGIITLVLLLMCAAAPSFAQEKKNLRMVFVSLAWNSEIPFRAALARGYFKQQGLQIEPILIRGGPAAIAALVSGEVDFASIGGAQAIFRAKARGLDLSIIGCISSTTASCSPSTTTARYCTCDGFPGPARDPGCIDGRRSHEGALGARLKGSGPGAEA